MQHSEQNIFPLIRAWYSDTEDGSRFIVARIIRHPKIEVRSIVAFIGERRLKLIPDCNDHVMDQGALFYRAFVPPAYYHISAKIRVRLTSGAFEVPVERRQRNQRVCDSTRCSVFHMQRRMSLALYSSYAKCVLLLNRRWMSYVEKKVNGIASLFGDGYKGGFLSTITSLGRKFVVEHMWLPWVCYILRQNPRAYIIHNPERIGHLASEVEILSAEIEKGLHPKARYLFVVRDESWIEGVGRVPVAESLRSSYLLKMIKRKRFLVELRYREASRLHPRLCRWRHELRPYIHRDVHGVMDEISPGLSFTKKEIRQGWKQLRALGLTPDTPFVCLHLRESEFVDRLYQNRHVPRNRYAYRDVDPDSYQLAVRYLMNQGIRVIRMGVPPVPKLSISEERYIDYANTAQSPFLDIFLSAHCLFFLGTTSGLYALADLFRRPILFTNFAPLRHVYSWSARCLVLPQIAYSQLYHHTLTIEEMLLRGIGDIIHGEKVEHLKIKYLANTKEEILDATQEMLGRLRGSWKETLQDWDRQARFWSMVPHDEYNQVMRSRISAGFLRKYDHLLPPVKTLPDCINQSL